MPSIEPSARASQRRASTAAPPAPPGRSGASGRRRAWLFAVIAGGALLLAACGDAEAEPTPTPTVTPTPVATSTPTPTPTPADGSGVRGVDLEDAAVIGPIIDHFGGGHIEPQRTVYTDMTGDGLEEAVVFVESGGTMGDLGVAIFGEEDGQARLIQVIEAGGRIEVLFADVGFGVLRALEAAPEPGDPLCCPSRLLETLYEWDGDEFIVVTEQLIDNPDA